YEPPKPLKDSLSHTLSEGSSPKPPENGRANLLVRQIKFGRSLIPPKGDLTQATKGESEKESN
ncbi:MAG: hypothetical protein ACK40X_12775, partial [Armatimonadota bacterium]